MTAKPKHTEEKMISEIMFNEPKTFYVFIVDMYGYANMGSCTDFQDALVHANRLREQGYKTVFISTHREGLNRMEVVS
jgi:hypothetical protein